MWHSAGCITGVHPFHVRMVIWQIEVQCEPILAINIYSSTTGKKYSASTLIFGIDNGLPGEGGI